MADFRERLSVAGAARREAMLGDLLVAMHAHHRRRALRRNAIVLGALAIFLGGAAYVVSARTAPIAPSPIVAVHTPVTAHAGPEAMRLAIVETDHDILERYRARTASTAVHISDDELLEAMRRMDRPAGLVRFGDEAFLTASASSDRPNSL